MVRPHAHTSRRQQAWDGLPWWQKALFLQDAHGIRGSFDLRGFRSSQAMKIQTAPHMAHDGHERFFLGVGLLQSVACEVGISRANCTE